MGEFARRHTSAIELRHPDTCHIRDVSGHPRPSAPLTYAHLQLSCVGPSLARFFSMASDSLRMIVILVPLVIIVWSLIALTLFSMWTENLEDHLPGCIIWLGLVIIGFSNVLVLHGAKSLERPSLMTQPVCLRCSSEYVKRVSRVGLERLTSFFYIFPFRCQPCGHRFRLLQWGVTYTRIEVDRRVRRRRRPKRVR